MGSDTGKAWALAQDARPALYLLCDSGTVEVAEALIQRVRHTQPISACQHGDETVALPRDLVQRIRVELGASSGQLPGARRAQPLGSQLPARSSLSQPHQAIKLQLDSKFRLRTYCF
jgi:hypothetical protein